MARGLILVALAGLACAHGKPAGQADLSFASRMWPLSVKPVDYPHVVELDGKRLVRSFEIDAAARPALDAAERLFSAHDCPGASEQYRKALELMPSCYPAMLGLGDCELAAGRADQAIELYRQAEAIAPDDFLALFSEADAQNRRGNRAEARADLIGALTLMPGRATILRTLHSLAVPLGLEIHDEPLEPSYYAFSGSGRVLVLTNSGSAKTQHWLIYAMCEVIGPPQKIAQEKALPKPDRPWSSLEEADCLKMLAKAYRDDLAAGKTDRDPALERLQGAIDAGMLEPFVLYEIGARMDPQIALRLGAEARGHLRAYIEKFVVVERPR